MEQLNKVIFLFSKLVSILALAQVISGCGVKGMPLPPLTPAPIGRGEPTYSEATKKSTTEKKKLYKNQELEDVSNPESSEGL